MRHDFSPTREFLAWQNTPHGELGYVTTLKSNISKLLLFSWIFREISMLLWLYVKSLALCWGGVRDLGLDGKHIWLQWNVSPLLNHCWYSSLLARRWCLRGATAGRLQLHEVGKLVIHGSNRCTGHLIFFVSGHCTKTASTPLVEDCICLVCWGLGLNGYHRYT